MEFLQVPETPAPEPVDTLEMPEECPETQLGAAIFVSHVHFSVFS